MKKKKYEEHSARRRPRLKNNPHLLKRTGLFLTRLSLAAGLHLETPQKGNPPRGGSFFRSTYIYTSPRTALGVVERFQYVHT